jgi:hypothetical protein
MNFFSKIEKTLSKTVSSGNSVNFASFDYTIPNIPLIIERRSDPWVWYGEDNLYSLAVRDLRNGSGIHNSIVKTKVKMTAGDGWLLNGAKTEEESKAVYQSLPTKAEFDNFMKNSFDGMNINAIHNKICDDYQEQGQFAAELVFNNEFTKIARVKYVKVENLRAGKVGENGDVESYWHCKDWRNPRRKGNEPKEIKVFTGRNKSDLNQLCFVKMGNNEYYGELPYKGCLNWIQIDFKMSLYHLSNIDNGMNPGMIFKFYKVPNGENDKQAIIDNLKKTYKGALKAGNPLVLFSENKELSPDISPADVSNIDKQQMVLAELCDKKILTGHQLTSPLLAGVSISGQLGGNVELEKAYMIYDNVTIKADRMDVERFWNRILEYNKLGVQMEINPFNPFKVRMV